MYASIAAIVFLGLALAWTALNKSGIPAFDWYISLLLIGAASLAFWSRPRRLVSPPIPLWLFWTICGWLLYISFQAIPLPLSLLQVLSPARAELTRRVQPVVGPVSAAPISVDPAAHILWLLTIFGCTAAFFLVRDLAFRLQKRLVVVILPLLLTAAFEGLLGLIQVAAGAEQAVGSYNSRDHYCCILEMTLPVAITFGLRYFQRRGAAIWPVLQAIGCWLFAAVITLGILFSLSRAGWIDAILSLLVLVALILFPRIGSVRLRLGIVLGLPLFFFALFVIASPGAMLERLVGTMTTDSWSRLTIWRDLVPLAAQFRWFGTGLLGFDPTFLRYQAIITARRIDFAHNDFLQYLIELGLIGFLPLMVSLGALIWPILKHSWPNAVPQSVTRREYRLLLVGCVGGFVALFAHSLVDFNLYVPANMLAFAWILGFASGVAALSRTETEDLR